MVPENEAYEGRVTEMVIKFETSHAGFKHVLESGPTSFHQLRDMPSIIEVVVRGGMSVPLLFKPLAADLTIAFSNKVWISTPRQTPFLLLLPSSNQSMGSNVSDGCCLDCNYDLDLYGHAHHTLRWLANCLPGTKCYRDMFHQY
mmetsp:Transcript_64333/g.88361  ORF Transcript_64333/g.88361 Transcript_64333/m.88361 type:complete len:144 (-) Transcript_64333:300-731(-)